MMTFEMSSDDVTEVVASQHQQVTRMLDAVAAARGESRKTQFDELVAFLDAHEAAEEQAI
jgi:hypothetical protein